MSLKKVAVKMFRHQCRNTILFRYSETIVLEITKKHFLFRRGWAILGWLCIVFRFSKQDFFQRGTHKTLIFYR